MEEQLVTELASAIRNEPEYSLKRVLSNLENKISMALFCLGTNRPYDHSLPTRLPAEPLKAGDFYVLFISEDVGNYYTNYAMKFHETRFFRREIDAAAWALDVLSKWVEEPAEDAADA